MLLEEKPERKGRPAPPRQQPPEKGTAMSKPKTKKETAMSKTDRPDTPPTKNLDTAPAFTLTPADPPVRKTRAAGTRYRDIINTFLESHRRCVRVSVPGRLDRSIYNALVKARKTEGLDRHTVAITIREDGVYLHHENYQTELDDISQPEA
jgi:hypothetical protein